MLELNEELKSKIFEKLNNFIIIGAFDGLSHDDIFYTINKKTDNHNTKIIFVEPVVEYFDRLKSNLSHLEIPQENIFLENCCVGDKNGEVRICYFNSESGGDKPWYIEGCACVVENDIPLNKHIREEIPVENLSFLNTQEVTVSHILNKYNFQTIDYLQIDTEGYDQRIVKSLNLSELDIKYLKFEVFYCDVDFIENLKNESDSMGYYFYQDWDFHLIRKDLI